MAPPDDYGWAYIDPQRASASADGPSGSLQFRYGSEDLSPGQFSGSEDLIFHPASVSHKADANTSGSALYLYGDLYVTGAVHANTYEIRQVTTTEIDVSGSTIFGDTADDTHRLTGSFEVSGHSTFSSDVLIQSDGSPDQPVLTLYSIGIAATATIMPGNPLAAAAGDTLILTNADGTSVTFTVGTGSPSATVIQNNGAIVSTATYAQAVRASLLLAVAAGTLKMTVSVLTANSGGELTVITLTQSVLGVGGNKTIAGTIFDNDDYVCNQTTKNGDGGTKAFSGGSTTGQLDFRRWHPKPLVADDNLGEVRFRGAESGGYHGAVNTAAVIIGEVGEGTWVDGASHPGQIYIGVTSEGDTTTTKRLVVTSTGLQVTGSLIVSGSTVLGSPGERVVDNALHTTLATIPHDFTTFHNTLSGGVLDATTEFGLADVHANKVIVNDLYVSGSTTGVTINFGDEPDPLGDSPGDAANSAIWGASDDFSIYHDGNNTILENRSTGGHLMIRNEATVKHIVLKTGTNTSATSVIVANSDDTTLWQVKGDGSSVMGKSGQTMEILGTLSASSTSGLALAIEGSASFGRPVDFSGDLTFNVSDDVTGDGRGGTVDFWVEGGSGPESALQLRKNGRVTKIGHVTPGNNQVLTWNAASEFVEWTDKITYGDATDDIHTTGDLLISGSALFSSGSLQILPGGDLTTTGLLTATGGAVLGNNSADTHQVTGSFEVSGPAIFSSFVQAIEYIKHKGDLDTHIRFQDDQIDFTAGNVKFLTLDETGQDVVRVNPDNADIDFMVSTAVSSGSLKIDGATGDIHFGGDAMVFDHSDAALRIRPMVGATSNQAKILLHSQDIHANDEAQLQFLRYTDGTFASGDNLGTIQFRGSEDEDGTYYTAASIIAEVDEAGWADGSSTSGRLLFFTTADGATAGTERMRIDDTGLVTIAADLVAADVSAGNIASTGDFVVSDDIIHLGDTNTKISFTTDQIDFVCGGVTMMTLDETSTDAVHFFAGSGSGGGTIYNTGHLKIDGDLYLGGNDLRDSAGNVVISFDGSGHIDNDVTIQNTTAQLKLVSTAGQSSVDLYGRGASLGEGDNIGAIRFYGTEDAGTGNSELTALIVAESRTTSYAVGGLIPTRMRFAVGGVLSPTIQADDYILVLDNGAADAAGALVGIGVATPNHKLDVYCDANSKYVAQFRQEHALGYGIRVRIADETDGRLITFSEDDGSNIATVTMTGGTVTYGPFTAYHPASLPAADDAAGYEYGTIVKVSSVTSDQKAVFYSVEKTTAAQDKAVLGVHAGKMPEAFNDDGTPERESEKHRIFAVGDGHILVCSENGDIETGDFICSSNTAGHGMKQTDDLMHSYTVAKSSESVDWATEGASTKLVACTYHAG